MSDLPTEIEVGDAHALRTFAVKDGRLTSIAQRGAHWKDGKCLAVCLTYPEDAEHEVPSDDCTCGVYAFWSVAELLDQYTDFARRIVTVVRMDGLCIEGDNGVKAAAAQVVAWWCCEDDAAELAAACAASAPGTRRYYDRDAMVRLHGLK